MATKISYWLLFTVLVQCATSHSLSFDDDFWKMSPYEDLSKDIEFDTEETLLQTEQEDRNNAEKVLRNVIGKNDSFNDPSITIPGEYRLDAYKVMVISSDFFPEKYLPNSKLKWVIRPGENATRIEIVCPIIRIVKKQDCKGDRLSIYWNRHFRNGEKRCGRIDFFRKIVNSALKVVFKANSDSKTNIGFICAARALPEYEPSTTETTTEPTTTPYLVGCNVTQPPIPIYNQTDCSEVFPGCYEYDTYFDVFVPACSICDMDVFAQYVFTKPILLYLMIDISCPINSLSGLYYFNNDLIVSVIIIIDSTHKFIDCAFNELTNLESVDILTSGMEESICFSIWNIDNYCSTQVNSTKVMQDKMLNRQNRIGMDILNRFTEKVPASTRVDVPIEIDWSQLLHIKRLSILTCVSNLNISVISGLEHFCLDDSFCSSNDSISISNMPLLTNMFIQTCREDITENSIEISSPVLECAVISLPCTENLDPNAISLTGAAASGTCPIETNYVVSMNSEFFPYIPGCPFYNLIEDTCGQLHWMSYLECQYCANFWMDTALVSPLLSNIHATCEDLFTNTNETIMSYMNSNSHPCYFIPFPGCV